MGKERIDRISILYDVCPISFRSPASFVRYGTVTRHAWARQAAQKWKGSAILSFLGNGGAVAVGCVGVGVGGRERWRRADDQRKLDHHPRTGSPKEERV